MCCAGGGSIYPWVLHSKGGLLARKGKALGGFPLPLRALLFNPISFTCIFGENIRFAFEENPHFFSKEKHKGHKCTEHGGAYRVKGGTRVLVESVLRKWLVDILCMRKGGAGC